MIRKEPKILLLILYPFSFIYGLIVYLRNLLFDYNILTPEEFNIPIISVGNITVGGTGKTPHIEYLVKLLNKEFNVATLSRGYKRKTRHFVLAGKDASVEEIGDEPLQIKHKFSEIHVAVDRKRANGIRKLMKDIPDLDVILLDDAYQHRYVKPGLSILLIDYNRPILQDFLLPAGRLREQAFEKRRANIILVTKCPDRLKPIERRLVVKDLKLYPFQHLYFTTFTYEEPKPVFASVKNPKSHSGIRKVKPHLIMVCGIANPRLFKKYLRSISTKIKELIYPDHHNYKEKDLMKIKEIYYQIKYPEKFIFTTEKDAMRLQNFYNLENEIKERMYYVPLGIRFLNEDTDNFNQHIFSYVRNNKRDSILYRK